MDGGKSWHPIHSYVGIIILAHVAFCACVCLCVRACVCVFLRASCLCQVCDTYNHTQRRPTVRLAQPGSKDGVKAFNVCHPRMYCSFGGQKETEQARMEDERGTMHPKLQLL